MKAFRSPFDVIIIGAGLAGGLLATRLASLRPDRRLLVLEAKARGSFSKTWSCHDSDLERAPWVRPLVSKTWDGYDVAFPRRKRTLATRYHSLFPETLHAHLAEMLGANLRFDAEVVSKTETSVTLADGTVLFADVVIDSSVALTWDASQCGFQKFVGLHVKLDRPHGLVRPMLMDASVEQEDGFRFFYVLPFSDDELLIEDTRFSENESLDKGSLVQEVTSYATTRGWTIAKTLRAEAGVLPLPLAKSAMRAGARNQIGMSAGFFHAVTGYSLPDAVRVADRLASLTDLDPTNVPAALESYEAEYESQRSYQYLLNRMMFRAAPPSERFRIFERFYGMPEGLISRFYRGELTKTDRVRILVGRPPVPVISAARVFLEGSSV